MKYFFICSLILLFGLHILAQSPTKNPPANVPIGTISEDQAFRNARAETSLTDRIAALKKFVETYPKSSRKVAAQELLVSTRAALGDQKLRLSEIQAGIDLFKIAVIEAPKPISDKLFAEIVIQFPTNLYYRNQPDAAIETAKLIEEKIEGNVSQMLGLAAFYIGIEYGSEAKRLAKTAVEIDPNSAAAFQTLGLAARMNFELDESLAAYEQALKLNPDSIVSKRSLAEMKRANGKADEAVILFREILQKDPEDTSARTGLVMSLFNAGRTAEAETELNSAIAKNPDNFFLLVGAAYWYAANAQADLAIEMAEKAIAIEPRYTWAHIALAKGLMLKRKPIEAEKTLLAARQYGDFPTLRYALAEARLASGLYREASDELLRTFSIEGDEIAVRLGGRVIRSGRSFSEVLAGERKASIFEPESAIDSTLEKRLKSLLRFSYTIERSDSESEISGASDEFVRGDDAMKIHRTIFAAKRLLEERKAPAKAFEYAESVSGKVDSALNVANPEAAVIGDELYQQRTIAALRNEMLIVPAVPRATLAEILTGKIDELAGWSLLQQEKPEAASLRFRRAVRTLPADSSFWRSAKWHLGEALEAEGKPKEALAEYLAAYDRSAPDVGKRLVIENVYLKLNGTTEGLDRLIGAKTTFASMKVNDEPPAGRGSGISPAKINDPSSETTVVKPAISEPPAIVEPAITIPETKPEAVQTSIPENVPAIQKTAVETETDPATQKIQPAEPEKTPESPAVEPKKAVDSIFDPIIINVPSSQKKPVDPAVKSPETSAATINSRPRLVTSNQPELPACSLKIEQENVSIVNDGGSLGTFVSLEGSNGGQITAVSNSPDDVTVELQSGIGVLTERKFYVFRSISTKTGDFVVTFESPCGKKEVKVNVR
ncbi:MAG: tetratricopeptide repeat protein [Pyrinomonadaceae bacterium]|nr:tetratricopeptide repeat protein [Pyrinomonadaceae bacterium]